MFLLIGKLGELPDDGAPGPALHVEALTNGATSKGGRRVAERNLMKLSENSNTTALEVLAASLAMRLTMDELEWLGAALNERAAEKRSEAVDGQLPVLAGYRDAWEP